MSARLTSTEPPDDEGMGFGAFIVTLIVIGLLGHHVARRPHRRLRRHRCSDHLIHKMHPPTVASHIRREPHTLVCTHCRATKEIRKRTTPKNVAEWVREHERCRQVRKP